MFRLATIGGSIILSMFLFQAIYVVVPHRRITIYTLGSHFRHSWLGALVATIAMQLLLQLFPIYATLFLKSYLGQIGIVFILLIYFYLFTLILLFGTEVNACRGRMHCAPYSCSWPPGHKCVLVTGSTAPSPSLFLCQMKRRLYAPV